MNMRAGRIGRVAALAACVDLAAATAGEAQTAVPAPGVEIAVTGLIVGPISIGSGVASLTRPDGSPLTIFEAETDLRSAGVEFHLGWNVTPSLGLEATGGWARPSAETRIDEDIELADGGIAKNRWDQVTAEASLLWTFAKRGALSAFLRGGGGWARDFAGGATLVEDAGIASLGGGVKYWWRTRSVSREGRLGFRVDGRAVVRSRELSFATRGPTVAPALSAGLILGF
jgi:hypothetical protein